MILREEPGWNGIFTRDEALGAWRNGTRIQKTGSKPGDGHPDGAPGVVLGSIDGGPLGLVYFVAWDDAPRVAVAVAARRVMPEGRQ